MENVTLKGQFLHDLVFETKEQAEQAASTLRNVAQINITDATEDVSYFVDVKSAWSLQFYTTYELDQQAQAVLSSCVGLIPEISPDFNLDAEYERQIAASMDEDMAAIGPSGLGASPQEATLFNDLAWKNIYTRIAIILLALLAVPLNALHGVTELWFPGMMGVSSVICLTLLAIALTLIAIAYFKDFRHVGQDEGAIR